jgi:hypothetical protein
MTLYFLAYRETSECDSRVVSERPAYDSGDNAEHPCQADGERATISPR